MSHPVIYWGAPICHLSYRLLEKEVQLQNYRGVTLLLGLLNLCTNNKEETFKGETL